MTKIPSDGPGTPGSGAPFPPQFDASAAWSAAVKMIGANREMMLVLGGLFFLIPQMLLGMLLPDVPPGMEDEAATQAAMDIFAVWWPLVLGVAVIQAAGMLTLMVLLCDSGRPVVRDAIRTGIKALGPYVGATLVLVAGMGILALLILLPVTLAAGEAAAAVAMIPILAVALWVNVRTLTLAPVVAVGRERNPFEALKKAWGQTNGSGPRILMMVILFLLAALVISIVTTAVPGTILIATLGQETGQGIVGVIEAFVSTFLMLAWSALIAASYRQFAKA